MDKIKSFFKSIPQKLKSYFKSIPETFNSYKRTFSSLLFILGLGIFLVLLLSVINQKFYNAYTDDLVQYYPIMAGFIDKIKAGNLSLYDHGFFHGASIFAQAYYVPYDIFTLITLIFSFIFKTEQAYLIANLLKILFGGLLFAHVLHKQGLKNKTVFLGALMFSLTGILITEVVYPVYLSLIFYIPLAIYVADRFIEDKMKFWYIPVYVLIVVFYDFYIAYMLLAFLLIYTLMRTYSMDKFSLIGKNTFIKNKQFYSNIFGILGLILFGVLMSMMIFLPSYLHITGKTFRNMMEYSLWKYSKEHFLDVYSTLFTPGNPQSVLHPSGGYIDNHASLFMTLSGLVYFVLFFFTKGKENNRLKAFIVIFNILLCIPLVSMIMTGTETPYIRWFFIVYMINLYCSIKSMEYYEHDYSKTTFQKIFTLSLVTVSVLYISYLFFYTENFKMYNNSDYKLPVIIVFLVTALILIVSLFLPSKISKHIRFYLLLGETIASGCIVFGTCTIKDSFYLNAVAKLNKVDDSLKEAGYDEKSVFKAAVQSTESDWMTNTSFRIGDLNSTTFFHSFYDSTINDYYKYYLGEYTESWSKAETINYYLPFAMTSGFKYIVVPAHHNWPIPDFYRYVGYVPVEYEGVIYADFYIYELKDLKPFTIYDEFINEKYENVQGSVRNAYINLLYGSFGSRYDKTYEDIKLKDFGQDNFDEIVKKYNLKTNNINTIKNELNFGNYNLNKIHTLQLYAENETYSISGSNYYRYNLSNINFSSNLRLLTFMPSGQTERGKVYQDYKIEDDNGVIRTGFYGTFGINCNLSDTSADNDIVYNPKYLYVKVQDYKQTINYTGYTTSIIDDYLENQKEYTEQFSEIDGNKMTIKVKYPNADYGRILKTNFAYSSEWKVSDERFETVNILGGFLGIVLPANTTECDITLKYIPDGFNTGIAVTSVCSAALTAVTVGLYLHQKKNKNLVNEESNLDKIKKEFEENPLNNEDSNLQNEENSKYNKEGLE